MYRYTARVALYGDPGPVCAWGLAQPLDRDSGNELGELPEIVLIAGDYKVAAERRGGDDGPVDRTGPSSAG